MSVFRAVALSTVALAGTTVPAISEGLFLSNLTGNYELNSNDPEYFEDFNYRAQDMTASADWLTSRAMLAIHDGFDLGEASEASRLGFLMTAGILNVRMQAANAVILGHEQAHWAGMDALGFNGHTFYNVDDGEELDYGEAYINTILRGGPGASAYSYGGYGYTDAERIEATQAGVNWQMQYSERWLQQNLFQEGTLAFDYAAFLVNRTKTMSYSLNDKLLDDDDAVKGDMVKIANYFEDQGITDDALTKMVLVSAVANAASPAIWDVFKAHGAYWETGDPVYEPNWHTAGSLEYTWDIPQYFSNEGMTVAPMAYFNLSDRNIMGADRVVVNAGVEASVIGDADAEYSLGVMADWGRMEFGIQATQGGDGWHAEADAGFEVIDQVSLKARYIQSDGETLRGDRSNPHGGSLFWGGVEVRF